MRRTFPRAARGTGTIAVAWPLAAISLIALTWGAWSVDAGAERGTPPTLMAFESTTPPAAAEHAIPAPPPAPATTSAAPAEQPATTATTSATASPRHDAAAHAGPTFDGRPLRPVRKLNMKVTAYSPDEQSCGDWADGWTASGYSVWTNGMRLVAADTRLLPFGTLVSIPGYNNGQPVQVLDRGGAIKGNRLDVLYPTHERALQWGVQQLQITVWEYAD